MKENRLKKKMELIGHINMFLWLISLVLLIVAMQVSCDILVGISCGACLVCAVIHGLVFDINGEDDEEKST